MEQSKLTIAEKRDLTRPFLEKFYKEFMELAPQVGAECLLECVLSTFMWTAFEAAPSTDEVDDLIKRSRIKGYRGFCEVNDVTNE